MTESRLYGGLSGITISGAEWQLIEGVVLRPTYAHITAPILMAFAPAGEEGHHPAPWKAARGGSGFDIQAEISISEAYNGELDPSEICWLVAALIRVSVAPFASLRVYSSHSFERIPDLEEDPVLRPVEMERRILVSPEGEPRVLDESELGWVGEVLESTAALLEEEDRFNTAFRAFDAATVHQRNASSLLALWGAIEQLFSPSPGELRFRVSSYLSSYLEPPGKARFKLYKSILKLYNARSKAAHTSKDVGREALLKTYVLARNALVRIIDAGAVPTQKELEHALFSVGGTPDPTGTNGR